MSFFAKITQLFANSQYSSIENSRSDQNLFAGQQKEKMNDPTASAETAQLVLDNLGQQFAAHRAEFVKIDGKQNKDGSYTVSVHPTELGGKRWSKEISPQQVTRKAVEKMLDDFGIKDENLRKETIAKLGNNELIFELGGEKTRKTIKTGDFGKRDLMEVSTNKLGGIDVQFNAEQVKWLKDAAQIGKINDLAARPETNVPLKTETAILGTTAIAMPRIGMVSASAAPPIGAALVVGAGVGWTAYQTGEFAYRNWEQQTRTDALPLPPAILNKAEDATKPETTVADKTKPQIQPIPDEADLPKGELAVRPKAQPQTPTTADNPAQPTIENVPSPYKNQPNAPQNDPSKMIPPIIGATTASIGKVTTDKINDTPGTYSSKINWGIQEIDVRPFGKGYWGKRIPQNNSRVDNYEIKINPNNESYYIPHPNGGYVQFENIKGIELQDGKLVMQTDNSIYQVYNKPLFLRAKILAEAQRQVEAAKHNDLKVEWLVSDEKTIEHLTRFFKENKIDIKVTYLPE